MKLSIGDKGEYELHKLIGKGAYGEVYIARDSKGIDFACKVQLFDTDRRRDTMKREIEVLRKIPAH